MHTQCMHYMHIYTQKQAVKAEVVTPEDKGYENGTSATGKHTYCMFYYVLTLTLN